MRGEHACEHVLASGPVTGMCRPSEGSASARSAVSLTALARMSHGPCSGAKREAATSQRRRSDVAVAGGAVGGELGAVGERGRARARGARRLAARDPVAVVLAPDHLVDEL